MTEEPFPSEPFPRARLSSDGELSRISASSDAAAERFQGELKFLGHQLPKLGAALQMKAISFGLIEDGQDQVTFCFDGDGIDCAANISRTPIYQVIPHDLLASSTSADSPS